MLDDALRKGDIMIVRRLDRLGPSLKDLIELLDIFNEKGMQFISLIEKIEYHFSYA